MKRLRNRLPFGMSARRLTALLLGICAPLTLWIGSTLMSADWAVAKMGRRTSLDGATNKAEASLAAAPPARWRSQMHSPPDGSPEGRLLEVYRLIGSSDMRQALQKAQALVNDVPNFHLAQLAYGDLLLAQTAPLSQMGAAPAPLADKAPDRLNQLRDEARRRIAALQERPPEGAIPAQFIDLPASTKHAIAVDASRSRLYVFENTPKGMRLIADHYASIGKLGPEKSAQGDQRTPIGVYYITSRLDADKLTDFYGIGALPLNYPNEYDRRLGRTGSGIWLHGVPSDSYSRSPQSTDGCVAMANPELKTIIDRVQPRSTPVVIARSLEWITPEGLEAERRNLRNLLEGWRVARTSGDINRLMSFYSPQFANGSRDITQWRHTLEHESSGLRGRPVQLKDLAILGWRDRSDILVVTFGELSDGERTGSVKRQYWTNEDGLWKIFFEGVIG